MANSFVLPGGLDTYAPALSSDLVVEFSRNPQRFPLASYCDYRIVDKQKGYYVRMQNNVQTMVINDTDNIWADGNDRQLWDDGTDPFTFPQYTCIRRTLPKMIGQLAIDQGAWDILGQAGRLLAMQMMTARVKRIHAVLTASANWAFSGGSNYATATTAGGGVWSASTNTTNYIRKSLAYAQIAINQATLGTVQASDLFVIMNPNVAKVVATSQEFLVFIQQQVSSPEIWQNSNQYRLYGLPEQLMGLRIIVDDTVYNSGPPGTTVSPSFTLSDSYVVILSKQKAVNSAAGSSYSTFSPFLFEDMNSEIFSDPENRRVKLFVTENIDDSAQALVCPQSGYLIKIDS